MFDTYKYAFQIETTFRAVFKCERYGIGVLAESYFIEKNPFIALTTVLGNFYNKLDSRTKEKVDEFIEEYHLDMGKSIEEIGEEKIKKIIKEFNDIVRTV
ncbi:MAG: hypothetical protein GX300_08100 [Tissierellia bacterium]|nr:hypothetical protein [Tissierellia bacterium]